VNEGKAVLPLPPTPSVAMSRSPATAPAGGIIDNSVVPDVAHSVAAVPCQLMIVGPHTPVVPPPPQVCGEVQVPQLPPHPSSPQFLPGQWGVQPQPPIVPLPPHVGGAVRVPQLPPQLSGPQFLPAQTGVQPHTPAVPPPPQVCGTVQVPHVPVQPSLPQF